MELVEGGADMDVTMDNVELYVQKCADFYLNTGIINQVRQSQFLEAVPIFLF